MIMVMEEKAEISLTTACLMIISHTMGKLEMMMTMSLRLDWPICLKNATNNYKKMELTEKGKTKMEEKAEACLKITSHAMVKREMMQITEMLPL